MLRGEPQGEVMGTTKILIVEDEPNMVAGLRDNFEFEGFQVITALDGVEGLERALKDSPDLIVLDVMMPKASGFELLPELRRVTDVPIVMLSARGEVEDKVEGLAHGADDYLSKPFEISELVAHVEAKLRRPHLETRAMLQYEGLSVDLEEHLVERDGRKLDLSPLEYDLLVTLLRRPRRVFTREELLDAVWGDADVGTGAVERYISYLRGKVDEGFDRPLIQTVRGAGYTLRA